MQNPAWQWHFHPKYALETPLNGRMILRRLLVRCRITLEPMLQVERRHRER
jgi:hypothetical protein